LSPDEVFSQSIFNVSIFGDERDSTLARWNYLQATLGTGKAFYSQSQPPVDIKPQNMLCRFKAMGYSRLPENENKMGLCALKFNKSLAQVKDIEQQLVPKFSQLFGSKPNMMVHIDSMKALTDTSCQVVIYLEEKVLNSNETKRIAATETAAFLNQQNLKYQLGPLGIDEVYPMIPPDEDQLKQYLSTAPKGIDPRMWRQAIADNPDPKKFIPVPLVGFSDLKTRLTCQENETANHVTYLAKLEKDIGELKQRHANTSAKIMEHRRKFSELSHRILRIIVKQESTRKVGYTLTPDEEVIKTKLENMHALVSAPTQFKGKLSELLSQMRMQRSQWASGGTSEYSLDKESADEMKNFLTMQQKAMELLIEIVNKDLKDLKVINDGMTQIHTSTVN
jgi:nuclear pore complex protein Nup54